MPVHRFSGDVDLLSGDLELALGRMEIPNGQLVVDSRILGVASGPPTSGVHLAADRYIDDGSVYEGITGWVCTSPGNPGVWAPYGIITDLRADVEFDFVGPAGSALPNWLVYTDRVSAAGAIVGAFSADAPAGVFTITADAVQDEDEQGTLDSGNNKWIRLDRDPIVSFRVKWKLGAEGLQANDALYVGVKSDHNNTPDNIAVSAWFKLVRSLGLAAILIESDDNGGHDIDDVNTGQVFPDDTWMTFTIDFSDLADVRFYLNGVDINPPGGSMDMSGLAGGTRVQPTVTLIRAQTGVGPNVHVVATDHCRVHVGRN